MEMQSCRMIFVIVVLQGSTLRKRKMYEEFLSKVSILGKGVQHPMKMQEIVCFIFIFVIVSAVMIMLKY